MKASPSKRGAWRGRDTGSVGAGTRRLAPARRGLRPARGPGRRVRPGSALAAGLVWALAAGSGPAAANSDGPLPGFTGGFGEPTCQSCHFDAPEEPDEGELVLEGVPGAYRPGERYTLEVVLSHPALGRGGFQLAARFADGPAEGRQAGLLRVPGEVAEDQAGAGGEPAARAPTGARAGAGAGSSRKAGGGPGARDTTPEPAAGPHRVEVVPYGKPPVLYARQTVEGAAPVPSHEVRWTVQWQAPDEPRGPVVFHATGNAANHDESEFGDVVLTAAARSDPGGGSR